MSPELREGHERWRRRFAVGGLALLAAAAFTASLSLASEPRVRAGVVRRVRAAQSHVASKPTATVKLRVPFLKQEHALSCEVATLRMALAYRGITVSEAELLRAIGVDPTSRRRVKVPVKVPGTIGKGAWYFVWGDPDEAFVGDVDGIMGKTGYGVYAGPIARVAGQHRRAEVITDGTATALAEAIASGNPVIAWGHLGRGRPLRWVTLSGEEVRAIDGEHTRVVIGYTGTREQPTGFFAIDPIYGEQYWKTEKFMANWEKLGRTGVMLY